MYNEELTKKIEDFTSKKITEIDEKVKVDSPEFKTATEGLSAIIGKIQEGERDNNNIVIAQQNVDLETEKARQNLEIEREKLELERKKLEASKDAANKDLIGKIFGGLINIITTGMAIKFFGDEFDDMRAFGNDFIVTDPNQRSITELATKSIKLGTKW